MLLAVEVISGPRDSVPVEEVMFVGQSVISLGDIVQVRLEANVSLLSAPVDELMSCVSLADGDVDQVVMIVLVNVVPPAMSELFGVGKPILELVQRGLLA